MTTTADPRPIPITDHVGKVLVPGGREPHPGSIVLTNGVWGTAWQRFFSDGMWYPVTGGRPRVWLSLVKQRNLVLVYDAPIRVEPNPEAQR